MEGCNLHIWCLCNGLMRLQQFIKGRDLHQAFTSLTISDTVVTGSFGHDIQSLRGIMVINLGKKRFTCFGFIRGW